VCGFCTDKIHLVEEVWQLTIVQVEHRENELVFHHVFDHNQGLAYEPHFFEFMCWEKVEEVVEEIIEDVPPVTDSFGLIACDLCGSHIREWETMGVAKFGELHCSPHMPDGQHTYVFEPMGADRHVCVACLTHINDEMELWGDDLEGLPGTETCRDGIFERCWRKDTCECEWRNK
jgi:hypothetical protein